MSNDPQHRKFSLRLAARRSSILSILKRALSADRHLPIDDVTAYCLSGSLNVYHFEDPRIPRTYYSVTRTGTRNKADHTESEIQGSMTTPMRHSHTLDGSPDEISQPDTTKSPGTPGSECATEQESASPEGLKQQNHASTEAQLIEQVKGHTITILGPKGQRFQLEGLTIILRSSMSKKNPLQDSYTAALYTVDKGYGLYIAGSESSSMHALRGLEKEFGEALNRQRLRNLMWERIAQKNCQDSFVDLQVVVKGSR
ncbi:hypothetical protein K491DRAFT_685117 [Lophiostoma macrostomum CBS 122681]|uniref:Uncharacterized protein n=1 Tax=Lophiostoma macrostomum CBS 122681 TaxID=1314788 RepID=A0A6A6SK03_9PLEO|nr:hypothetical protein K491DRAFT_685117 [Lophiostoma macrostomum CBS 122681]